MKKAMLVMTVIGSLCLMIVTGVTAAMKKPPRSACYSLTNPSALGQYHGGTLVFNSKLSGMRSKSIDGKIKFYFIQASIGDESTSVNLSLNGGGYWDKPGNEFEGTMDGQSGANRTECFMYLSDVRQDLYCTYGSGLTRLYNLDKIDCKTIRIQ